MRLFAYVYCHPRAGTTVRTNVQSFQVADDVKFVKATARDNDFAISVGVSGAFGIYGVTGASWQSSDPPAARGFNNTSSADTYSIGASGTLGLFRPRIGTSSLFRSALAGPPVEVKLAMVITPSVKPAPPPIIVQAVEFYHAASDHYFITAIPKEISDLDNKVHPGWARTGQSFNAYAAGSGGPSDRLPVCRYYGLPQAGLDSHFYTGGVLECLDVGAKFAGAWEIESGEVFQMRFPDVDTGACPAGTTPVMRTWNQRTDSNHRYMTSIVIRDQMKANGSVSEGYGPEGVVFCAPA